MTVQRGTGTFVVTLLLLLTLSLLRPSHNNDNTVCVKVMDDIRSTMSKEDSRQKPAIEKAMGDYCQKDGLSAREKKICYYIDPIKRDVAQPFSLGMPSLKVCQRINKSNPEICTVKFPVK